MNCTRTCMKVDCTRAFFSNFLNDLDSCPAEKPAESCCLLSAEDDLFLASDTGLKPTELSPEVLDSPVDSSGDSYVAMAIRVSAPSLGSLDVYRTLYMRMHATYEYAGITRSFSRRDVQAPQEQRHPG